MENNSGGISNRVSILGYLAAVLAGIAASVFVPASAPVIGMMLLVFGIMGYRSGELHRLAAVMLIAAGAGIVVMVLYVWLFLVNAG